MFAALRGLGPGCDAEFGGLLIFALCFFLYVTHSVTAEADALKLMFPDGTDQKWSQTHRGGVIRALHHQSVMVSRRDDCCPPALVRGCESV